jgi:hypothetical protein
VYRVDVKPDAFCVVSVTLVLITGPTVCVSAERENNSEIHRPA